jgi:hypothetical protein
MSHKGGGEGVGEMIQNVTWGETGSKKCRKNCHIFFLIASYNTTNDETEY